MRRRVKNPEKGPGLRRAVGLLGCIVLVVLPTIHGQAPPGAAQAPAQTPQQEAPPAQAAAEQPPAPAVKEEQNRGSIDFGYRWILGQGGNQDVYRSIINLGEGPKLFQAEASLRRPNGFLYDRIDLHASSWGGDPYNTARLDAARTGVYDLRIDYRNVKYFSSIPSFANPFLESGILFSERSFDIDRRYLDSQIDFRPGARFSPYLAYYHSSGFGRGVTTFVSDSNEFPVGTHLRDGTDSYRGGVHVNLSKLNITLEQGGTVFKDDQQVGFSGVNPGNRTTPVLGQTIVLKDLYQAYGARGSGIFSRGVIEARPSSKLSFSGQVLYSKPSIDVKYLQQNSGNFLLLSTLQLYTGQLDQSLADANRPHTSGSWSSELRPLRRLRIIDSWFTDRFHIAAGSLLGETFLTTTGLVTSNTTAAERLVMNYSQHQVEAVVDVASFLSLRGGHRYEWGDAGVPASPLTPQGERANLSRQIALAGASVRIGSKIDVNADLEASAAGHTFFRTDLADYQRGRLRGRYHASKSVAFSGAFAVLNNQNAAQGVRLDYQSRQSSLAVIMTPREAKRWSLLLDYTRGTLRSSIPYLAPQDRTQETSLYRDNGHFGGAALDLALWRGARLTIGGGFSLDRGSRPTRYLQPRGSAVIPLWKLVSWTAEWRWFGFDETLFGLENFHTNLFATGLRIAK